MADPLQSGDSSEYMHMNGEDDPRTRVSGDFRLGHDPYDYSHLYADRLREGTAAFDEAHGGESSAGSSPRRPGAQVEYLVGSTHR